MKKILILFLTLLLPAFLFLEMWSSYRYNKLEDEMAALEQSQEAWLEKNKKIITGIAVYNSPQRISKIAEEDLGLVRKENWEKTEIIPGNWEEE